MNGFLGAIQFLTRVPIRSSTDVGHARVVPWFGVVGVLIGAAVGGTAAGLSHLVPTAVAGACAVAVGLLITGAFHEDGLADIADAFGGGWSIEQRLELLDDPRHGTYGVAALSSSIVIRVVCAASIAAPSAAVAAFVAAHGLGRVGAVVAMRAAPSATDGGLGVSAASSMRAGPTITGLAVATGAAAVVCGWWILPFLGAAIVGAAAVVALAIRKIGGVNGDALGAVEQVVECLVLVVATGLAARHTVWWA